MSMLRSVRTRINGVPEPERALQSLAAIRTEASQRGIVRPEFEARRAMAEIEGRRSAAAGQKLREGLKQDAKARGFRLYAR
jgi:hypothetical protein